MILAIDFDGTIVEHRYPTIGKEIPNSVKKLRELRKEIPELKLILWTCREGKTLKDAVSWCNERGLVFDAVNENVVNFNGQTARRKIYADYYIDDKNIDAVIDWDKIYDKILWIYHNVYGA